MAYMYVGPGKMTAMAMASGAKNHDAMIKEARKVPTIPCSSWDGGQMYMVSGHSIQPAISIGPENDGIVFLCASDEAALAAGLYRKITLSGNRTSAPADAGTVLSMSSENPSRRSKT